MAEFKLDRFKYNWKNQWAADTAYLKDDIVYYRGKTYVCVKAHTSTGDFFAEYGITPRVSKVTIEDDVFFIDGLRKPALDLRIGETYKFDLSDGTLAANTFKFSNRVDGPINDGVEFTTGVVAGGSPGVTDSHVKITVRENTPNLFYYNSFEEGYGNEITISESIWKLIHDGTTWKEDWTSSTYYTTGDIVKFKGYVYQCTKPHTSVIVSSLGPINDIEKWKIVATTYNWLNRWTVNTNYDLGDVIKYNGIVYICIQKHRSRNSLSDGLEFDQSKWSIVSKSDDWKTDWQPNTRYRPDDVIKYGAISYRCVAGHTSAEDFDAGLEEDLSSWEVVVSGIEYKFDWTADTRYKLNDIIKWRHSLWICVTPHTSQDSLRQDESKWTVWLPGLGYEELWSTGIEYRKGDIVLYGGYTYTALENNFNSPPSTNGILQDTGDWELLKEGYKHRGEWNDSTDFKTGDVVRNNGILYIAVADSTGEYPDSGISWQILVTGKFWRAEWDDNATYYIGDVVTYASTSYVCTARHTSTASDSRPDIDLQQDDQDYWILLIQGTETNVLTTRGDIRTHDDTDTVRLGIGIPGELLKVQDALVPFWENFEEIQDVYYVSATTGTDDTGFGLTLNAPFRTIRYACQYVKDNVPAAGINTYGYDVTGGFDEYVLSRALTIMAASNSLTNASLFETFLRSTNPRTGAPYFDITSTGGANPVPDDVTAAFNYFGGVSANEDEENLRVKDIINYLYINANAFSTEFVLSSTDVQMPVAFQQRNATIFVKTGIYSETLPISIPRNTALVGDELRSTTVQPAAGFETSNMFYVNNGSGIRNMTLQGLNGQLSDTITSFGTRRPTAGAYVSLDPGLGADDISVWITNKSPYIQNVTTFGTGCIGMKIDGSLHNGGNKSTTANDFTQILSDGIGYWASNGGLSELVSVFTYYNYIGYLATEGGKLRATNGNNSYGTYGCAAEGVNPAETPITGEINNRSQQALINTVHTNGNSILALGYDNAGQDYSIATLNVLGSNVNFDGRYTEFRDEAIYQARLIDPADSSIPGGLNYQYLLNNAQGGDTTSILIAASDSFGTNDAYTGMRLFIESGAGAGQYGYISSYDPLSKLATISREIDDAAGWEHIYPGYPIAEELDNTTRYSIEPRSIVAQPTFTTSNISIGVDVRSIAFGAGKWVAIENNSQTTNYSTDGDTWTVGSLGTTAAWNNITFANDLFFVTSEDDTTSLLTSANGIAWTGRTFNTGGVNYKVAYGNDIWLAVETGSGSGDSTQISDNGGALWIDGGAVPFGGQALDVVYGNGKFVIVEPSSTNAAYTVDGETWTSVVLPINRAWTAIKYGNGRFVLIGTGGDTLYSFDAITWYSGAIPDESWTTLGYGQGLFLAASSTSEAVAHSRDGLLWTTINEDSAVKALNNLGDWSTIAFGNPNNAGSWIFTQADSRTAEKVLTGAQAFIRTKVGTGRVQSFIVYDPGSGYKTQPTLTIIDPEATIDALSDLRIGNGVLAQPEIRNRGSEYTRATGTVTGNGFSDNYQTGNVIVLKNLSRQPGAGDNLDILGIDSTTYRITRIESVSGTEPNLSATIRISPRINNQESPDHENGIIIRQEYSQIRLTGHDFLDIGTGNFNSTKYPELYIEGTEPDNERQPFNEVFEIGGGRVFYTSTDQDGNFRVGELFAVEQATGIVSINADFFELGGLEELSLGGIQVGGSAVVIREFSKESTFTANSNNIVPTQAAIIKFLESRISGGGANAITNVLIASQVRIGQNNISTTSGLPITVKQKAYLVKGADGHYLASMIYGAS